MVIPLARLCTLTICRGSEENITHVYNWGECISDETIKLFEKETGYKVIYETYAFDENLYVKLPSSIGAYDVAVPPGYLVERCIERGLVQKINREIASNLQGISDSLRSPSYGPGSQYSIPYLWGTLGAVYNGENAKEKLNG